MLSPINLLQEAALLQTIDRLKTTANVENKHDAVEKKLKLVRDVMIITEGTLLLVTSLTCITPPPQMAAPKKWMMSDGVVAEVETAYTTRAKVRGPFFNLLMLSEQLKG